MHVRYPSHTGAAISDVPLTAMGKDPSHPVSENNNKSLPTKRAAKNSSKARRGVGSYKEASTSGYGGQQGSGQGLPLQTKYNELKEAYEALVQIVKPGIGMRGS